MSELKNEIRVFGPPGTGKTTWLSRQIENAAAKHGGDNIMVASFTKAAAFELNSRNLPIPRDNIGTLHSLCYRAMNKPPIAETQTDDFNKKNPAYAVTKQDISKLDEMYVDQTFQSEGDKLLAQLNIHRARLLPVEAMPASLRGFYKAWEIWKMRENLIDFTDMIALTAQAEAPPPGEPKIGIYDECQDFNKMQFKLIRHWAKYQEFILIAGDDDQSIFQFTGASPDAFLTPDVPREQKRILGQSWRLPKKVQEFSMKYISQIKHREVKDFQPRQEEGEVKKIQYNYRDPMRVVDLAEKYASNNKTVMILTSCGFMLDPLKAALRECGVPFHNPFRRNRADWNPLGNFNQSRKGSVSTKDRLLSFLYRDPHNPYWTPEDFARWIDIVKIRDVFRKGGKDKYEDFLEANLSSFPGEPREFLCSILSDVALERGLSRDTLWFRNALLADKKKVSDYPLTVYGKRGIEALRAKPKITVGTIHSVKGGEADVVIMFPDVSRQGFDEYRQNPDPTIRQFYVGMTRARETLLIGEPISGQTVKI